jgi:hypothetical protein
MNENIRELHQALDAAELHADRDTLNTLLADDFRGIGPRGFMLDKAGWISRFDRFAYSSLESREVDIQSYNGVAIVREVQQSAGAYNGQDVEMTTRVCEVWIEKPEGWKLASIQFSPMDQEKPPAA